MESFLKNKIITVTIFFLIYGCSDEQQKTIDCASLTSDFIATSANYNVEDLSATSDECQANWDSLLALWDAGCDSEITSVLESLSTEAIETIRDGSMCAALHSVNN